MSFQINVSLIFSAYILIYYIESTMVEFDSTEYFNIRVPYRLQINDDPGQKFPVDNFLFAFELLSSLKPPVVSSIADVTSTTYTGDDYHAFSIKRFTINTMNNYIEMFIEFRKEAHATWFRIRYSSFKSEDDKEKFYKKDSEIGIIFEKYIQIFLRYTIKITVSPEILNENSPAKDVLLPDQNGLLTCSATEGLPNSNPQFINSYELEGTTVNVVNNYVTQLIWRVRPQDHGKQIVCQAGQDQNNVALKVYHYMTGVLSDPIIEEKLQRGTHTKCYSKDGYPTPKTQWIFINGPLNASNYYKLQQNDTVLFINLTAPLNSNWTFECSGSMDMPSTLKTIIPNIPTFPMTKKYYFVIKEKEKSDDSIVQSSSTGLIVVLILLMIVIICGTIAGIIYRDKIKKFITDKKNNTLPKTPEKALDPGYKYCEVDKVNGTEKEDATCYLEIVGTVQPKSLGPIHRV